MKLVIAEKPVLARDIARAICGRKVSESERLPISGNGYTVVACAGHLLELVEPDDIRPEWGKPWRVDVLPIQIDDWKKRPSDGKEDLVKRIKELLPDADMVINAGDPDDEGQLLVDEVIDYLGYRGPVMRVYVNDNIEKNIAKAFDNLVPNDQCRGAGRAADARSIADKIFGVNESRLATCRLHSFYSVGRVQTPTLGLVVRRDEEIANHVSRKYFELYASGQCQDVNGIPKFKLKPAKALLQDGEKHVFDREPLEKIKRDTDGTSRQFETTIGTKTVCPPLPYNLTVLLSDMSRRYGFAAAKTQQITQDLRDKYKAITYNRSDSQYLKEEHFADAPATLAQAMRNLGVNWPLDFKIHSKAFNDANVTAHHGIIPQDISVNVSHMTPDEAKVYTAIVERYAMQFLPPAVYDVSTSTFPVDGGTFACEIRRLRDAGFKATFGNVKDDDDPDAADEAGQKIWIEGGTHQLDDIRCDIEERETTPPKPYTEGTLIADMASISKYVKDKEVKAILKQKDEGKKGEHGGIGTTATRSSIIEKLKERGYIEDVKNKVRSTEKGREFYHLLPPEISGADVTARWWLIQQDVADGKTDINAVQRSVIDVFNSHKDSAYVGASVRGGRPAVGTCPQCGKDVVQAGKVYTCSSNRSKRNDAGEWVQVEGCGFKVFPSFCGKSLTTKQVQSLLSGKQVPLKGCVSKKTGKSFDCKVKLERDGKLTPIFESRPSSGKGKPHKR